VLVVIWKVHIKKLCSINHFSYQKARMNDIACGIRIWAEVSFLLSQSTRLTDPRTDGQTAFSWLCRALHYNDYMQSHGKNYDVHVPLWQRSSSLYWTVLAAGWALVERVKLADDGKCRHGAESKYRYSIPTQFGSYPHSFRQPARRVVVSAETWMDPDDVTSSIFDHLGVQPAQNIVSFLSQDYVAFSWRMFNKVNKNMYSCYPFQYPPLTSIPA